MEFIICVPRGINNYVRYQFDKDSPIWKSIDCFFLSIEGKINIIRTEELKRKELKFKFKKEDLKLVKDIFNIYDCSMEIYTKEDSRFLLLYFNNNLNTLEVHSKILPLLISKVPKKKSSFPVYSLYSNYKNYN